MSCFVLEIGSEEIPARFLASQQSELENRFITALEEASIAYGALRVFSTPRRAIVCLEDVEPLQREKEEIISGPPVRVAYGADSAPTKALEGFLRTNGVNLEDVFVQETDKGAYVAVRKRMGGAQVADLLADICPNIIAALPFAKKMRWGAQSFAYARPLRWVLALFDDVIVPFSIGPLHSGRNTWGHRIHGQQAGAKLGEELYISVNTAQDLLPLLREKGGIEPDANIRYAHIVEAGNAQAKALKGTVLWKDSLLTEVQGLCEHPVPLIANFDPSFLEVPREVLLTSMESHQKSFGLEDASGNLLPHFLTVLNMTPVETSIVQKGWERVLRARLEDARFFWRSDMQESFEHWLKRLDAVIFLGPLGSMGDKTRRLEALCAYLANVCGYENEAEAARAGRLSKADLVSGMVGEFDTLQGIMGGIYASKKGEAQAVAAALQEQYLPAGPDTAMPSSLLGALLSIADKADTLVGCFGLGMMPTGTADPNGLRRCALGIMRCLLEFNIHIDVHALFAKAQELYGERAWKINSEESLQKLEEFFAARLKNYWQGQQTHQGAKGVGQVTDTLLVDAILGAGSADVCAARGRLEALQQLHASERFIEAVQTFKRVANIVRKQGQEYALTGVYSAELLEEEAEKNLAKALDVALPRFDSLWQNEEYTAIPALLLDVRPAVDGFFDAVMVMCDAQDIRMNRLNLLKALMDRMSKFADFSALQV